MKLPDQIDKSPKTTKQSVLRLLQAVGLNFIVENCDDVDLNRLDAEQDLVALYRILCMAGIGRTYRGHFEYDLNESTLDHIERQYEPLKEKDNKHL